MDHDGQGRHLGCLCRDNDIRGKLQLNSDQQWSKMRFYLYFIGGRRPQIWSTFLRVSTLSKIKSTPLSHSHQSIVSLDAPCPLLTEPNSQIKREKSFPPLYVHVWPLYGYTACLCPHHSQGHRCTVSYIYPRSHLQMRKEGVLCWCWSQWYHFYWRALQCLAYWSCLWHCKGYQCGNRVDGFTPQKIELD